MQSSGSSKSHVSDNPNHSGSNSNSANSVKPLKADKRIVFACLAVVLVLVLLYLLVFSHPSYKFFFNINGVQYYSNEFTPSEFFSGFRGNDSFFVSIDLVEGSADSWSVNALNLWLVALNYDNKKVYSVVRTIDSSGVLKSCMTNDANILESRVISAEECSLIMDNKNNSRVLIKFGQEDKSILSPNKVEIFSSSKKNSSFVNYWVIKQMYPDFDSTLAKINERIGAINPS